MKWILIVLLIGPQNPAQASVEFNTVEACEAARDHIRDQFPNTRGLIECFAKGNPF